MDRQLFIWIRSIRGASSATVRWIDGKWKTSKVLAFGLVIAGMSAFLWAAYIPHSTGVSIALLACMAGVMSVRQDMHIFERIAWVMLLISFTVLEVIAIHHGDQVSSTILAAQAKQAEENLFAVTGGDSYVYATFVNVTNDVPSVLMNLHNSGKYPLTNITSTIAPVVGDCGASTCDSVQVKIENSVNQMPTGTIAPFGTVGFPHILAPDKDGSGHFLLTFNAQNGMTEEDVWLRKSKNSHRSAYKYAVVLFMPNQPKKIMSSQDWTEPAP